VRLQSEEAALRTDIDHDWSVERYQPSHIDERSCASTIPEHETEIGLARHGRVFSGEVLKIVCVMRGPDKPHGPLTEIVPTLALCAEHYDVGIVAFTKEILDSLVRAVRIADQDGKLLLDNLLKPLSKLNVEPTDPTRTANEHLAQASLLVCVNANAKTAVAPERSNTSAIAFIVAPDR